MLRTLLAAVLVVSSQQTVAVGDRYKVACMFWTEKLRFLEAWDGESESDAIVQAMENVETYCLLAYSLEAIKRQKTGPGEKPGPNRRDNRQ